MPDQEVTVSGLTYSIGNRLAMSGFNGGHKPRFVYVIGDGEYGSIVIGQSGMVESSDVYPRLGDRKKFIKDHRDALFFPANQKALDDLNEFGFRYFESVGLFAVPEEESV